MFRADELTEIAGGAVSYRQVGANLQGHALQMIHERYRPGAQSGTKMLSHQGEEAGLVIKGRLALEVDGRRYRARARRRLFASTAASLIPFGISATRTGAGLRVHAAELLNAAPSVVQRLEPFRDGWSALPVTGPQR